MLTSSREILCIFTQIRVIVRNKKRQCHENAQMHLPFNFTFPFDLGWAMVNKDICFVLKWSKCPAVQKWVQKNCDALRPSESRSWEAASGGEGRLGLSGKMKVSWGLLMFWCLDLTDLSLYYTVAKESFRFSSGSWTRQHIVYNHFHNHSA